MTDQTQITAEKCSHCRGYGYTKGSERSPMDKLECKYCKGTGNKFADQTQSYSQGVSGCDHCDTSGGEKTYANQACLPLNGRVICVDWCIHQIVAALNAGGVQTIACCCGHGKQPGRIDLADGRKIIVEQGEL